MVFANTNQSARNIEPRSSIVLGMILVILLLVPALDLIFNNNGLDNMLYAKRKANTSQVDRADTHIHTNEVRQNQKQVTNKVVILTFGDIHKSQFTNVKPILDQYGFKGSFFYTVRYGR